MASELVSFSSSGFVFCCVLLSYLTEVCVFLKEYLTMRSEVLPASADIGLIF